MNAPAGELTGWRRWALLLICFLLAVTVLIAVYSSALWLAGLVLAVSTAVWYLVPRLDRRRGAQAPPTLYVMRFGSLLGVLGTGLVCLTLTGRELAGWDLPFLLSAARLVATLAAVAVGQCTAVGLIASVARKHRDV